MGWEPPIDGEKLELAMSCNFVCCHPSHGEDKRSYCTKSALHSDDHSFECAHIDDYVTNIIDIVFCVDTTASMGSYIDESKTTCKRIIKDVMNMPGSSSRTI